MHLKSSGLGEPVFDVLVFVGGVIAVDDVNPQRLGLFAVDLFRKAEPPHVDVAAFGLGAHGKLTTSA